MCSTSLQPTLQTLQVTTSVLMPCLTPTQCASPHPICTLFGPVPARLPPFSVCPPHLLSCVTSLCTILEELNNIAAQGMQSVHWSCLARVLSPSQYGKWRMRRMRELVNDKSELVLFCAVCKNAGTQVSVDAGGQATTTKVPPSPAPAPKSNITGTTPVSPKLPANLLTCMHARDQMTHCNTKGDAALQPMFKGETYVYLNMLLGNLLPVISFQAYLCVFLCAVLL